MNKEKQLDDFFGFNSGNKNKKHHEGIKETLTKNPDKRSQIRLLAKILSKKERYFILLLLLTIVGALVSIPFTAYHHFTKPAPNFGGSFVEGIVGEPLHINPLLLSQTGDADRDLANLIYSGLLKYNGQGKLVPDLAKSYEISSDGLNYTIYLKENAKWHDNTPVTADDVVFTIQTAQNGDYNSLQRVNWLGIEVEKLNETTLIFKLKNKYAQFLNNLTIRILPKHLWENVKPSNFALSELNLKPVGSGPYKFSKLKKDKLGLIQSYELTANRNFYDGRPYINDIELKFYNSESVMIDAYNKNEIDNLGALSAKNLKKIKFKQRVVLEKIKMPRYFSLFFNQSQSKLLSDKNLRLALAHATNKKALIDTLLDGNGIEINSPLIGEILDINTDTDNYGYDQDASKKILHDAGWDSSDENGILIKKPDNSKLKKGEKPKPTQTLSFKITTSTLPELTEAANIIKEQWKQVGVNVEVESLPTIDLQQAIKDRSYQILLFGEILNIDPDPFVLWHSSQKRDPGLNLALYDNKNADKLLEDARQNLNPMERAKSYDDFQKLIVAHLPAIFLYSPFYIYGRSKDIQGFDSSIIAIPSDRFSNIERWYINTKRVFK